MIISKVIKDYHDAQNISKRIIQNFRITISDKNCIHIMWIFFKCPCLKVIRDYDKLLEERQQPTGKKTHVAKELSVFKEKSLSV